MAQVIKFTWTETDQGMVDFYTEVTRNAPVASSGVDLLTDVGAYRLQITSPGEAVPEAPVEFSIQCDLAEDFEFEVSSEFEPASDVFGAAGSFLKDLGNINQLFTGSSAQILNIFEMPRWKSTAPLSISLSPIFYTRTNSQLDVLAPMFSLMSLTILKLDSKTNAYRTPGVYLGNVAQGLQRDTQAVPGQKDSTPKTGQEGEKQSRKLSLPQTILLL